jgi:hemerythrin superfamily protein
MSIIDKVIAAVTPPETDDARFEARQKARAAATPGGWLALVLDHHVQIETAFAAVQKAADSASRRLAQKQLAIILNGHSLAEEVVLYPALSEAGKKGHMTAGYTEQCAVKVQMALLEDLEPMSQDYLDKLEHIKGAVAHHMYEEEGNWFLDLQTDATASVQSKLTARYQEEFQRYMGGDAGPIAVTQQAPSLATL